MVSKAKAAGELVTALFQAIEHGQNRIASIPGLLKQVIREEAWREYALPHSSVVHNYRAFKEFVEDWLGITIDDLKAICTSRGDYEALDLVDKVTANLEGHPTVDNVNSLGRPTGNANTYALRKLRKDRPDLHARVIKGELSPHAAMIEAGFRRKQISVVLEPTRVARAINRHFDKGQRRQIIKLVEEGLPE